MKKIECDRCEEIHDPSESKKIEFKEYPCDVELCPGCWKKFKVWMKL